VRERFAKFRTCSSSPCSSNIFCYRRRTNSFYAGVFRPSEVSTFSALSFLIPLKSSNFSFPLLLPLGSLGVGGGEGPLDQYDMRMMPVCTNQHLGMGKNKRKEKQNGKQVSKDY